MRPLAALAALAGAAVVSLAHAHHPPASEEAAPRSSGVIVCTVTCTGMDGEHVPCGEAGDGVCADTWYTTEASAMPYASRADLVARFGASEIDDLAPVVDGASPRADAVLADVDADIDSRLADRFDLPLPPGEYPALKSIAADKARGRLYDDDAPERVLGRMSSAEKRLREIVSGDRALVDADGRRVPRRTEAMASGGEGLFSRRQLRVI